MLGRLNQVISYFVKFRIFHDVRLFQFSSRYVKFSWLGQVTSNYVMLGQVSKCYGSLIQLRHVRSGYVSLRQVKTG